MASFKAIILMALWSAIILYGLHYFGMLSAHRDIGMAFLTAVILLAMHMFNMIIYFQVAGNKPYRWFKA